MKTSSIDVPMNSENYPLEKSPSSWKHRIILISMALICLLISSYLASYQLGIIANVWDPFFGEGSKAVLHSSIARALPFPDAMLGAGAYFLDIVLLSLGGNERWRNLSFIAFISSALVLSISAFSLFLLAMQPLIVHAWCFCCIMSASLGLCMMPLAFREFKASFAYLKSRI